MTDYERFGDYQPSERGTFGVALSFLFIGMGIGALSALLFAPKTGKQVRKLIRRKYEDARDVIEDFADQAGDVIGRGADLAESAKDFASNARDSARDFAQTAKERVAPFAKSLRRD